MPSQSRRCVLLIEDDPINLELVQAVLEADGFDVLIATNGPTGIDLARRRRPDLILMDLQMPEMDGLQATRILQSEPDTSDIPVIALSAHVRKEDMARSLDAGCTLHLPKPIDTRSLAESVTRVIESAAERAV